MKVLRVLASSRTPNPPRLADEPHGGCGQGGVAYAGDEPRPPPARCGLADALDDGGAEGVGPDHGVGADGGAVAPQGAPAFDVDGVAHGAGGGGVAHDDDHAVALAARGGGVGGRGEVLVHRRGAGGEREEEHPQPPKGGFC